VVSPWLSVITVVKDDSTGFTRTLNSLLGQHLDGVEFVVVDGSADWQTLQASLRDAAVVAKYMWEPPQGIYPAMNSGLSKASGEFVYFANAGDTFFSPDVLARTRPFISGRDWAFGPVEIIESDGRHVFTPSWDYAAERATGFSRGLFPSHQGTFARRTLLLEYGGFDAHYSIAADYAMILRLSQVSDPALLPFVVATFREGGASTLGWEESFRQFHRARREILNLSGQASVQERWNAALHFTKVWTNRVLLTRLRRSS
jgi:glycosyltransferase involved in cell wall biosynthesis